MNALEETHRPLTAFSFGSVTRDGKPHPKHALDNLLPVGILLPTEWVSLVDEPLQREDGMK